MVKKFEFDIEGKNKDLVSTFIRRFKKIRMHILTHTDWADGYVDVNKYRQNLKEIPSSSQKFIIQLIDENGNITNALIAIFTNCPDRIKSIINNVLDEHL